MVEKIKVSGSQYAELVVEAIILVGIVVGLFRGVIYVIGLVRRF